IAAQEQPWLGKYNTVRGIANWNGDGSEKADGQIAYACALVWHYTGEVQFANKAIAILNKWKTFNGYNPVSGQNLLVGGWIGSLLGPAAELMRGYTGWAANDRADVIAMFKRAFYPVLNTMSTWNGNVDLTQIEAMLSIAVFCEDEVEFNLAIQRLKLRNPAYFYMSTDNANSRNYATITNQSWNAINFVNGLTQETCRLGGNYNGQGNDNGHHAQYALCAALHAAEIAWNQGVDVYGENQDRYVAALELLSIQLTSGQMQNTCADNVTTKDLYNTFEVGYNHYHNRMKLDLPNTWALLTTRVRIASDSDWNIFHETLTHDLDGSGPACEVAAPTLTAGQSSYSYAIGDVASKLSATGANLLWYPSQQGVGSAVAPTPSTSAAGTTTYYVSQTVNGVEGCKASIVVNVINIFMIPRTEVAPVIDGTIEALWDDNTYSQSFTKEIVPTVTGAADLSGTFKSYWDNTYLYVLGNVNDDALYNDSPESYFDDGIELYIDINNDKAGTYSANDVAYNFGWNNGVVVGTTPAAGRATTNISYAIVAKTGGYVFEARIPWTTLQGTPVVNQLVGLDFHVNDDDNGAGRDGKLSWAAATDDAWQNPSLFGTAKLGDIILSTSAQQITEMNKIQVYPNPSNGFFNITSMEAVSVKVFDNVGRLVNEFNLNGSYNFGSDYSTGLYHVQLINSDGVVKTLKIVKEN
ncbi:MAG: sugar-binding protein, partial [Flavobacteriales bacterium]